MNSTLIIVLCMMCSIATAKLRCGNDSFQYKVAKDILKNDCKGRLGKIDACCVAHTNCYKRKKPQSDCDFTFCSCMQQAANFIPLCILHAGNFCATARAFGGLHYNKSPTH